LLFEFVRDRWDEKAGMIAAADTASIPILMAAEMTAGFALKFSLFV
jgi:hypothetical protein